MSFTKTKIKVLYDFFRLLTYLYRFFMRKYAKRPILPKKNGAVFEKQNKYMHTQLLQLS